ncbi:MAG TPA: hypothetical protein VF444_00170 [Pseudonocardiaceae bacterium]
MGLVLPSALDWVLNLIGINWPNIDEDELRSTADELRQISSELTSNTGDAQAKIAQMLSENSSQALTNFQGIWDKLAKNHLPQLGEGMKVLAEGLDISAVVVIGLKVAAIVQLGILAAEIIADEAAAPFTFGASEALIPIQVEATSQIMKQIIKKAVNQIEEQLLNAVEGPIFSSLGNAAEEMAGQLVGDAVGTNSGIDLGSVGSAATSGFTDGVKDEAGSLLGSDHATSPATQHA